MTENGSILITTEDHPFWNTTDQEWQQAQQLDPGDRLYTANNLPLRVAAVKTASSRTATAYNLTVHDLHTYYVLAREVPVLVHNSNGCGIGNVLRNWPGQRFQFGDQQFMMDKRDLTRILERRHPKYWDGSAKKKQSFLDKGMTIGEVQDAVFGVLRQNRDTLISRGATGMYQITGSYRGVNYVLDVNRGHVRQFYKVEELK